MESNRHPQGWRFFSLPAAMKTILCLILSLGLAALASAEASDGGRVLPEHHAEDPGAPAVTAKSLLASERFWPYQATLTKPFKSVSVGSLGVLIRVEPGELARIDFGRDGIYDVPVSSTDLVERSNAVRLGTLPKEAPNFVYALGVRMLDPVSAKIYPLEDTTRRRFFLCVFADPWRKEFGPLVSEIEARRRPELLPILFPQGRRPDTEVRDQLQAMSWKSPFVFDHLAEPYTRTLLAADPPLPSVQLVTAEGRVLYEGRFSAEIARKLDSLLGTTAAAK